MQNNSERQMRNKEYRLCLALVIGVWMLCACSVSRHLPENTYMLNKVRVVTDGDYKDINTTAMKEYVR